MKKWMFWLSTALILAIVCIYGFIPAVIKVQKVVVVAANEKGIAPLLRDTAGLAQWWKHEGGDKPNSFYYNNIPYTVTQSSPIGCTLTTVQDGDTLVTQLHSTALNKDSTQVAWGVSLPASNNPLKRIQYYWQGVRIKKDMEAILMRLQNFAADMRNLYGIQVDHAIVKDTLLIATEFEGSGQPTNALIYSMIDKATAYLKAKGAKVTNPPLLSVITKDSIHYKTMVALPIDKEIAVTPDFSIRRMFAGNILITEVKGGPGIVAKAFAHLEHYRWVHSMTSPAKPFETLVTNRLTEPDSSKWVTKIYYPIF